MMAISTSSSHNDVDDEANYCCSYCGQPLDTDQYLLCGECEKYVHIRCLRDTTPGDLSGDVFFDFTCANCMQRQVDASACSSSSALVAVTARERFVRQHMSWLMVITLTLYNLSVNAKGLGNHGYFHWRTHIVNFIDKHWDYLFPPNTRRRKNWIGSISGNISHNSPAFFLSGQEKFQEAGWWKLTYAQLTPRSIYNIHMQNSKARQQRRNIKRSRQEDATGNDMPDQLVETKRLCRVLTEDTCSRMIPYMGCKPRKHKTVEKMKDETAEQIESPFDALNMLDFDVEEFLAENINCDSGDFFESLPAEHMLDDNESKDHLLSLIDDSNCNSSSLSDLITVEGAFNNDGSNSAYESFSQHFNERVAVQTDDSADSNEPENQPRIIEVIKYEDIQTAETATASSDASNDANIHNIDIMTPKSDDIITLPQKTSLFTKHPWRPWPWIKQEQIEKDVTIADKIEDLNLMSEYEERKLLKELDNIFTAADYNTMDIPVYVRRFYRKLRIRDWKRKRGKTLFNMFDYLEGGEIYANKQDVAKKDNVIDRYHLLAQSTAATSASFLARLIGSCDYELIESPYTQRILHPFIYRNSKCFPPRLKLMCEVQYAVLGITPTRSPIDFCYVRPNHIPAVNALLESEFWPGIDMSECLSYPDFSVIALYRKLVVGCGFLVPDVRFNEAYISFMAVRPGWQRSGIGTFMLYHLIQTCMSKDITLHVSATNPAVVLYQKFGFKIEEVIVDFYDKYLPLDAPHSANALFLRLKR